MKKSISLLLLAITIIALVITGCSTGASSQKPASEGDKGAETSGSTTNTDESWSKVEKKGEFVLGLDDSFPPMGFRDDNNEIVGFDIDVAKEVASRLGVELKIQPINWNAKEQELNTGNIDCIWNGFTITEERKQNLLFSEPYMNNQQVFVVKVDSAFSKKEDFEGKKLAVQDGSSGSSALDEEADFKNKLGEVVLFDNYMAALMDLEKGGVDVVLMDEVVARYYITLGKPYKVLDEALATEEYGVGFRKNDNALMAKVQETLDAMAEDGKLAEIATKWFGEDITTVGK